MPSILCSGATDEGRRAGLPHSTMAKNDLRPTRVQDLNLRLRTASLSEVEWMVGLAGKEGWNPGADDAVAFRPADPDGFFVATAPGTACHIVMFPQSLPLFALVRKWCGNRSDWCLEGTL